MLEVSGLELMPDGQLIVGTRRGDIYLVDNAYTDPADKLFQGLISARSIILGLWRVRRASQTGFITSRS